MASKSSSEKCSTRIKGGKVQEAQNKIAQKLQSDLERDILRLFQESVYCDIKFTVHSSSLLAHSCILRARASRFYKFIYAEFEVFEENGISVFNIYNASFAYLQTFVENIYTNVHSFHAEEKIIKHLKETKNQPFEPREETEKASAATPDADLFFTPKASPSELRKSFTSPKLKISENDVASYYKITVDDIPLDEKFDGKKSNVDNLLEKELAEQDELLSSFQVILLKKNKTKPNSLTLGTSSQSGFKKTKPKFSRKFDSNLLLVDNQDKNKYALPHWKPNPVQDRQREKYLTAKNLKKTVRQVVEKVDLTNYAEDPTNSVSSDMDVSTTAGDSGLDASLICQQETSPKEVTMSETSGVDLTEAAINEDIPNDETISTKQSSGSSVTSEAGTWDGNDDFKVKSPSVVRTVSADDEKNQLNDDEMIRLDEMERNIRDCEMFLYMERKASLCEDDRRRPQHHSMTTVPGSLDDDIERREKTYQYAKVTGMTNPEESRLQGETDHRQNYDEDDNSYNYSYSSERNLDDGINPEDKNYERVRDANEYGRRGEGAGDTITTNLEYFAQPDILKDVQEAKTPPCTPKKIKKEEEADECEREEEEAPQETKSRKWENNNSTVVSNYFIDASSLLDDDEIISPPISLINFKSVQNEPNNNNNNTNNNDNNNGNEEEEEEEEEVEEEEEEPKIVSKKVVTNFYAPDSTNDASYLKENERRQGDIIFKNSIPHYSKHEVEEKQVLDCTSARSCGGADSAVEDESEQVVPSADIEYSPPYSFSRERDPEKSSYVLQSDYYEPVNATTHPGRDHADGFDKPVTESVKEVSSSVCSPNLRRRNESAPILSGGNVFVEEEKIVQKKPSQSQGEAWIVTFDDEKKPRQKPTETRTDDGKAQPFHIGKQTRRKEPTIEFYIDGKSNANAKVEPKAYPVEKSSSSGYFLDFSNDPVSEETQPIAEVAKTEKKNMFSMFIGMDDNSNATFTRNSRPTIEREGTFDKSIDDGETPKNETPDDRKRPFYMFIESDSPNVKRKQMPRRSNRSDAEPGNNPGRRNYVRTESYTIERNPEIRGKREVKTDFECSSSDNSLPYSETNIKASRPARGKLPLPLNKFRGIETIREPKITAWAETKKPNNNDDDDDPVSSESWLRSNDIQINYRGRKKETRNGVYGKKEFGMGNEKHKYRDSKPAERDSGVILSDKGDDSFVKLSDLDSSDTVKQKTEGRMSHSITEERTQKSFSDNEIPLSKSLGNEGAKTFYDRGVNRSLSRLFPNLNAQSLARITRRDGDGDVQASETSEVSSSMQSSIEPTGLEISTSETDVSTHVGTSSRLGEDLLKMFLEEISPDLVVEVNGRRIKAHKCILSSRCQYFAAMLSGGWVESAGNVISLQGFSYNAVHFALRHIYSGESRIPESLSIVELATLADMLCLDGLQEIISYNLKVKYCHSFHVPCSVCSVGVIDCLPIAAAYGLDDLYRKCLRWITKYFVKIWPTKSFGSLPRELLEKCYQHYVVHMTVDNVLDTVVNIDKVRGSLPNVRWAESVSRLVNKLHDATVRYIAEHFSSVLTSDNFLALGKEAGWNVSRLEDSLIETIRYLPPEQACWSHARLHRILSIATGPDPPPEMDWNENFLKLLQLIAELVENSLIKQAPRAAKSKAWRQMEPELRSRIQEAACLVLPDQEQTSGYRRTTYVKKDTGPPSIPQTAKSRNLEIRQIKLAMSQHTTNRNPMTNRPLSLQMDQRSKKDSRFIPLRTSASTSSVRKTEPSMEGIRKTQSRSHILERTTISEPKKTVNPRYSEVKSRYLEPKSPLKTAPEKPNPEPRRNPRYISSSDSSRNCSPALRSSNSRSSIPQAKKTNLEPRQSRNPVLKSGSMTTLESRSQKTFPSGKTLNRSQKDEDMSTDSLCTDSLASEKEATIRRRAGKENLGDGGRKPGNGGSKSNSNSPVSRRHSSESWSSATSRTSAARKASNETKSNPPKRFLTGKIPTQSGNASMSNASSQRTTTAKQRNQRNGGGRTDANLVNGNAYRKRNDVDSENNKKNLKDATTVFQPAAVERSGTFLKDEPTILKKPQVEAEA